MRTIFIHRLKEMGVIVICMMLPASFGLAYAHSVTAQEAAPTPDQVIQGFDQALLQAMRTGPSGGFPARYRILAPIVHNAFASGRIAQLLVGPVWSHFSPSQQKQLSVLFEHYTVANYAMEFSQYHGETFRLTSTKRYPAYQVVITQLVEENGKTHTFAYLMEPIQGHWKIINIFVDGVSNIAMLRSQYLYIVRKAGPQGLLHYLQTEITKMENPSPTRK